MTDAERATPAPGRSETPSEPGTWVDAAVGPSNRAPSLAPAQPRSGVLWVTSGEVAIDGRRPLVARKGDVVAYHDDGTLRWSAAAGVRVRWSARAVDAKPGEARPWTPELSRDLPTGPARPRPVDPRRRAIVAVLAALAAAWLVAWIHARSSRGSRDPAAKSSGSLIDGRAARQRTGWSPSGRTAAT